MASFIWDRDPQEAMDNPYEYEAQKQFIREAEIVLSNLSNELQSYDMKFSRDNRSIKKAIWMLFNDSVDSLKDILFLLKQNKHRTAGKLFRDVLECLDLASYFYSDTPESNKKLIDWYNDTIIPNRIYRNYIKELKGDERAAYIANYYSKISKFNHRTYKVLLYGYVLGRDDLLAYDGYKDSAILVLPQTIAMYLALLGGYIKYFSDEILDKKLVKKTKIKMIWKTSFKEPTIPRQYVQVKYRHDTE